jgi:hypothetical protein
VRWFQSIFQNCEGCISRRAVIGIENARTIFQAPNPCQHFLQDFLQDVSLANGFTAAGSFDATSQSSVTPPFVKLNYVRGESSAETF